MRRRDLRVCASALLLLGLTSCGPETPDVPQKSAAVVTPHFTVRGRWQNPHDVTYRIEDRGAPVAVAAWREAVIRACEAWSATRLVTFVAAVDGAEADVTLGWRRGHHGACEPFSADSSVAHSGPVRAGTFVHFDGGRTWSVDDADDQAGYSIYGAALHELGHILGLGHSIAADAIMRTGVIRSAPLAESDLLGLQSIYGGGNRSAADLKIESEGGKPLGALRGVCPADLADYAVLDVDGNGKDEVLVWRTDRGGNGQLMVYHFGDGAALIRTTGPFYGAVAPDTQVLWMRTASGERVVLTTFASGQRLARRFDDYGILGPYDPARIPAEELAAAIAAGNPLLGDLDGDGRKERVIAVR